MQTITDEKKIVRGARWGKALTLGSLAFLVGGLIVALQTRESPLLWVSLLCLVIGILASSAGLYLMNRWVRQPRADQALQAALKGLDDRYRLYNYRLPAPHVLLSPTGLYVLTALGQDGAIRYEGGKFHRSFSAARLLRFLGEEGLGKPFADGDAQVRALREFLQRNGAREDVDIQNILVFYHPRAEVMATDPPRPVVVPKGLKRALRKPSEGTLSAAEYRQLQELFDRGA